MVTIESELETQFVKTILGNKSKFFFLGARRNKFNNLQYKWNDGRIINFTNWDVEEPNNADYSHAHCVMINERALWHDYGCDGPGNKIFCQKLDKSYDAENQSDENVRTFN
ncbi:hypothetical protein B4U80_13853 [Leptotrombidium deliense]|uniref:C-type lectin domain-containing protein n=1 Tax=Leptotrombidium deliense TaxID=299467 RepID=A0A443SB53_9ACAR|nr:hypothetical protein B4U80_13853 [Leptotrombidium deliense]